MRHITGLAAAATVVLGLAIAGPAAAQTRNFTVQGQNPDGSGYGGTLQLQQDGAASYRVEWRIGNDRIEGWGMTAGNILSAAYVLRGRIGLVIYQIMPDGHMTGQWTLQGSRGVGTETLVPR